MTTPILRKDPSLTANPGLPGMAHSDLLTEELRAAQSCLQRCLEFHKRERDILETRVAELQRQAALTERARNDFLAVASHELRTPLTSILGFLELTIGGLAVDPQEEREYLQSALDSANELRGVVHDILEMAELEAGEVTYEVESFDLVQATLMATEKHRRLALEKGLEFRIEELTDLPSAEADIRKVQTVLRHLLSNAVKFTAEGSITISFQDAHESALVGVQITDTGVGFPTELRERLTQGFSQAEDPTIRRYGGIGLGLAVSSRLIRAMDGKLVIHSRGANTGTRVAVWLRAAASPAPVEQLLQVSTSA